MDTVTTVTGNLTAKPETRYLESGVAVVNFTVASTPRVFDRASGKWKDGEPLYLPCTVWREQGENAAICLDRGSRVIVQGYLKQRRWENNDGENRSRIELLVEEIGPSLRFTTARIGEAGDTAHTEIIPGGDRDEELDPSMT